MLLLCSNFYNKFYLLRVVSHVFKRPTDFSPIRLPLTTLLNPYRSLCQFLTGPSALLPQNICICYCISWVTLPCPIYRLCSLVKGFPQHSILIVTAYPPPYSLFLYPVYYFNSSYHLMYTKGDLIRYHLHRNTESYRGSIHNYTEVTSPFSTTFYENINSRRASTSSVLF